jgi:hypothetical protein
MKGGKRETFAAYPRRAPYRLVFALENNTRPLRILFSLGLMISSLDQLLSISLCLMLGPEMEGARAKGPSDYCPAPIIGLQNSWPVPRSLSVLSVKDSIFVREERI